ncbi:phage antirepressor KilAC domain-containing protein [Vibrio metschnikovii]|nr:phage antirepressor KilAC domain-containing protein [Vibrio metschnikovii]EKO3721399.1 phage antirepressor KilAC domain-containing protein [Vibrio metschnikovii]EKO3725912.1 phage antirepressor KilAC domain-containing protein [Vibrio metschnikovii]EKO3772619.1 phage antirepressor KilAC domain-containing protein [Vibrio metschnikovii]EKO3875099.1 phage antirepressor KilAC domain-containing protein [Vibrio metschnikovii]
MLALSTQAVMTMSSREIATLTGKDHKNVLRLIRSLMDGQVLAAQIEPLKFEYRGQWFDYFELNKRDSLVVVARLSPQFTAVVIDRWQELERSHQPVLPTSFAEALQLAANQAKELEQKTQQLALVAPKVEFADAVAGADKGVLLGHFAKTVGLGPITLFRILRELKIFMSRGESYNLPYQEFIDRGYFAIKQGTYEAGTQVRITHTALITGKGEMWLRKRLLDTGYLKAVAS